MELYHRAIHTAHRDCSHCSDHRDYCSGCPGRFHQEHKSEGNRQGFLVATRKETRCFMGNLLDRGRMVFIHVERILSCFLLPLFLGIMPMSRMHRECGNSGIFRPGRGLQTVCSVSYQASGKVRVSFWVPYGCRFR